MLNDVLHAYVSYQKLEVERPGNEAKVANLTPNCVAMTIATDIYLLL